MIGTFPYFEDYVQDCIYELGESENGRKISRIPEKSRYIKSEEILYEIRKIQQSAILQESIESNLAKERGWQNARDFLKTKEGGILNAKIYNLDTEEYKVQKWSELENVRYFYEFFKNKKNEFEG